MSLPESEYFPHDREKLLNTVARFDNGVTVEDVVGKANESYNPKYSHTVLIQVLLEFICHAFVKREDQREKLLTEVCKRLSKYKMVNEFLIMDKSNEVRVALKQGVINFIREVCDAVIPNAELDATAVDFFESGNLSTDLKLLYCKDFKELDEIGKGGFGKVFKVENRLTKFIYAVKKIGFNYKSDARFLEVMREANNFCTLDHPNIVRYHHSWIEVVNSGVINKSFSDNGSFTSNCSDRFEDYEISEEFNGIVIKSKSLSSMNSDSNRLFDNDQNFESSQSSSIDFVEFSESAEIRSNVNWTIGDGSHSSTASSIDESTNSESDENDSSNFIDTLDVKGILYIQMEYCDCDLHSWLDKRATGEELPFEMDVTEMFTNILDGVAHIHSKGIIHRDLKPRNIFYSRASNILKIGDFGLATLSGYSGKSSDGISAVHSTGVGTIPYAAPEQKDSKNYDTKADIYSLGIILIELMNTCSTRQELADTLTAVKGGKVTEEMKKFPKLVDLVKNLISNNPSDRMSAKEILNLFDREAKIMLKEKEKALKERDETIKSMQETIHQQNLEIIRLKAMINKLHIVT